MGTGLTCLSCRTGSSLSRVIELRDFNHRHPSILLRRALKLRAQPSRKIKADPWGSCIFYFTISLQQHGVCVARGQTRFISCTVSVCIQIDGPSQQQVMARRWSGCWIVLFVEKPSLVSFATTAIAAGFFLPPLNPSKSFSSRGSIKGFRISASLFALSPHT